MIMVIYVEILTKDVHDKLQNLPVMKKEIKERMAIVGGLPCLD